MLIFLYCGMMPLQGQDYRVEWASAAGGNAWDMVHRTCITPDNHFIITGSFGYETRVGDTLLKDPLPCGIFIAEFDSAGEVLWLTKLTSNRYLYVQSLVAGQENEIFMAVAAKDTLFAEGMKIPGGGNHRICLLRYNKERKFAGSDILASGRDIHISSVIVAGHDTLIVAGHYSGRGTICSYTLPPSTHRDAFVARINPSLAADWLILLKGKGHQVIRDMELWQDRLYIAGDFTHTLSCRSLSLTSAGASDLFLGCFSPEGDLRWMRHDGGPADDHCHDLSLLPDHLVAVTGNFRQIASFADTTLVSQGNSDIFLAAFTADGQLFRAVSWGGDADDTGTAVSHAKGTGIFLGGNFKQSVEFGPLTLKSFDRFSDAFILLYVPPDSIAWIRQLEGTSETRVKSMVSDRYGDLYLAGQFYERIHPGNQEYFSAGKMDILISKLYDPCIRSSISLGTDRFLCEGYTDTLDAGPGWVLYDWNNGMFSGRKLPVTDAGTYHVTGINEYGCVASDTVSITIDSLRIIYRVTDEQLPTGNNGAIEILVTSGVPPYTFHWSHGTTGNNISRLKAGTYYLTVTDSAGCEQTAEIEVMSRYGTWISTSPNPFTDLTSVSYSITVEAEVDISLFDEKGILVKKLVHGHKTPGTYSLNLYRENLVTGVYIIRMTAGKEILTRKIIITNDR